MGSSTMHHFAITITMSDGSTGQHEGFYATSCDAVIKALDAFPEAARISVRRLA